MKNKFKHIAAAMTLALIMIASPTWGVSHAADEAINNQLEKPVTESYMDNEKIVLHNMTVEKKTQTVRNAEEVEIAMIAEMEIPMAGVAEDGSGWALLNLIIAILTGFVSVVLLAGYLCMEESEEGSGEERADWKSVTRLMSLIPAVSAVIFFILTENMNNPIVLTDRWTIVMAAIMMIQKGAVLIVKKSENKYKAVKIVEAVNA